MYQTGEPEIERRAKSELSIIITKDGGWKEWCIYLGIDESLCNIIEQSELVTQRPFEVAQAYMNNLNTCWKKVVLILCRMLVKPNCRAARDVAKSHGIDYTTICTCS